MNKRIKGIIIAIVAAIVVCYATYFIFSAIKYSHSLDTGTVAKKYLYFFKDSVRRDIRSNISYSYVQKNDVYNNYIYNKTYYIIIWEFKNLKSFSLGSITFNQRSNLTNIKFGSGETINAHYSPEITMEYGFNFDYGMRLCYDEDSELDTTFQSKDYKAFYGNIHKILLRNVKWDPQILFDYTNSRQYGLFIFYKENKKFYILIINSDRQFDPQKLIKIFNLK